jgi:hypothetical protein
MNEADNLNVSSKMREGWEPVKLADHPEMKQQQADAVDNSFMKQSDPRMPLFAESKATTSFGKGK